MSGLITLCLEINRFKILQKCVYTCTLMMPTGVSATSQESPCPGTMMTFVKNLQDRASTTLKLVGHCLFAFAMVLVISGIAFCIWGYLGTAIRPFQISGPVCIGLGFLVYVVGCILCCREHSEMEKNLKRIEVGSQTSRAIDFLKRPEVVELIQTEPEVFAEFQSLSTQVAKPIGSGSSTSNVLENAYVCKPT